MLSNNCSIILNLHYFYFLFDYFHLSNYRSPVNVIIISLVYYDLMTILWCISYHIHVVDFLPVCLHWSDQSSLILKLVIRCNWTFSLGHIQTGLTDFLPLQVCGRSWWGCRLGIQTCLLQLIAFLDPKYSSSSPRMPSFLLVTCVYHIYWIIIHWPRKLSSGVIANLQWDVSKMDIQICPPQRLVECCSEGDVFCDFTCRHQ